MPSLRVFIVEQLEFHHLLGYLNADKVPGVPATSLQVKRPRALMAHAIRRMEASGKTPVLTDGMTLRILQEDRLPTLTERQSAALVRQRRRSRACPFMRL